MNKKTMRNVRAFAAAVILLAGVCLFTVARKETVGAETAAAPSIRLDGAFSDQGMATEIEKPYGAVLTLPRPIAVYGGKEIAARTEVTYLAGDGWEAYALPADRNLVVGAANAGDENKTAMYRVTYSAAADGRTAELVYTVYAGLQFSNRSAWANAGDVVGFAGEEIAVPTTKIQYVYKTEAGRNVTLQIEPEFSMTYFGESGAGEPLELYGASRFTPERAGTYTATYATPAVIKKDGVVYIRGSQRLSRTIRIYRDRSNPVENGEGVYECSFTVGGTSDTGKGMIASSCADRIQIEKAADVYYMHFTQTAANYMFNLKMTEESKALGNLVYREEASGARYIREYVVTLDARTLAGEIDVSMYIGPMSRDVAFTVRADLENAYKIRDEIYDLGERPALYVPVIQADSAVIVRAVNTAIRIPEASAALGEEICPITAAVYYAGVTGNEPIAVEDGVFVPDKTGTYYIAYTATSESYRTSLGNPSETVFERQVVVGKAGEIEETPDESSADAQVRPSMPAGAIAGIAAGTAALGVGLAFLIVFLYRRKRK